MGLVSTEGRWVEPAEKAFRETGDFLVFKLFTPLVWGLGSVGSGVHRLAKYNGEVIRGVVDSSKRKNETSG